MNPEVHPAVSGDVECGCYGACGCRRSAPAPLPFYLGPLGGLPQIQQPSPDTTALSRVKWWKEEQELLEILLHHEEYFNTKANLGVKEKHKQMCTFNALQLVWSRKMRQLGSGLAGVDDPEEVAWRLQAAYFKEDLLRLWMKTKHQTEG